MEKREKILLGGMGLAVLYAAYALLLPSPATTPLEEGNKSLQSVQESTQKLTEDIGRTALTPTETFILTHVEQDWTTDPFLGRQLSPAVDTPNTDDSLKFSFHYTGYIAAGNKSLAIINGMEYQVGEQLEVGGYIVTHIDPEKVMLQNPGKRGTITVPFTE